MASLGELFVKIGIDSAAFEKSITGLTNKVKAAGEQMQDAGQSASLYLTAPLALLGGAALKTAAQIEQTEIAFTSMLGSAEAAQQFVKELTQFAANTPFEMEGLSMASKTLLGFGVESENVLDTLKTLGDIAAGSGAPLEQLSMVFGQVKATGKAMTQDLYQFINAGVPIFKLLAEEMGVSEGAIKDLAAEGKITFDVVNGALQKATQEGGLFQNQMEKQSKSLSGLWSTFSDSVTLGLGKLGFAISEAVNLGELIPKMTKYVEMLVEKFNSLDAGTKKIIIIVGALVAAIGPLLLGLGFFMSTILPALTTGLGALGSVLSFLVSPVGLLVAAIVALAAAALYLWQNWEAVTDNMSNAFAKTVNYIIDKIKDLVGGFSSLLNKVGINALDGLTDKLEALKKPVLETTKEFKGFGESMKDAAKSVMNNFIPTIDELPKKVEKKGEQTGAALAKGVGNGFAKSGVMESIAPKAIQGLQSGLDKFEGTLSLRPSIDPEPSPKAKKGAKSMLQAMEKFIVLKTPLKFIVGNEQLKALTKKIGDSLKKVFDKVGDYAKKVVSGLKGLASPITGGMEQGGGALGALMEGNVIGALVSLFGDLAKESKGFAKLMEMINSVMSSVMTALAPAFDMLVTALHPLVGIIQSVMSTLGEMLISVLEPILPPLMQLLEIVAMLFEGLKPLVAAIGQLVGIILDVVIDLIEPLLEPLMGLFDMITLIVQALGPLIRIVGEILTPIFEIIGGILEGVIAPILAIIAEILKVLAPILELVKMSMNAMYPILNSLAFLFKGIEISLFPIIKLFEYLGKAIQAFVDWIKEKLEKFGVNTDKISQGASIGGTTTPGMSSTSTAVDYSSYGAADTREPVRVEGQLKVSGSDLIAVLNNTNKVRKFTT